MVVPARRRDTATKDPRLATLDTRGGSPQNEKIPVSDYCAACDDAPDGCVVCNLDRRELAKQVIGLLFKSAMIAPENLQYNDSSEVTYFTPTFRLPGEPEDFITAEARDAPLTGAAGCLRVSPRSGPAPGRRPASAAA